MDEQSAAGKGTGGGGSSCQSDMASRWSPSWAVALSTWMRYMGKGIGLVLPMRRKPMDLERHSIRKSHNQPHLRRRVSRTNL